MLPSEVIKLYCDEKWTLRMIAEKFNTDHHKVQRILARNGIEVTRRPTLKEYTDEHRRKVGLASKGRKTNLGKKMPKSSLYKNMLAHLGYSVSLDWLMAFEDVEKLKFLNRCVSKSRDKKGFTDNTYRQFIERFYDDPQFNRLYRKWLGTGDKWMRPSLDHIKPKCNGGLCDVENLQFLTWFENRAKNDMSQEEWENVKAHIGDYLS